jgi:antitoxin CptB
MVWNDNIMQELLRKKLSYRSKNRGCKETDLLLGNFATKYINDMTLADLNEFEIILDQTDSDIVSWVMGRQEVPSHLQRPMMMKLLSFQTSKFTS